MSSTNSTEPRLAALPCDLVIGDVASNLATALAALEAAARAQVDLMVLPEMWPTSFTPRAGADLLAQSDEALAEASRRAAELGVLLAGSAYGPVDGGGRPSNRLHLFEEGVDRLAYDKVHLFSPTAEHLVFHAGTQPSPVVQTRIGKVTGWICYDLRFPEHASHACRQAADVVVVPAQWPSPRASHWIRLAQARAIDAQAHLVACNRSGRSVIGRRELVLEFPGNALIVSPHGEILAQGDSAGERVEARIEPEQARELRRLVPLDRDARPAVYRDWYGEE